MWRRAFRVTGELYLSGWVDFLILVVSFVFSVFLSPSDLFGLRRFAPTETALLVLYTLTIFVLLFPVVLLANVIIAKNAQEHPSLLQLGKLRSEGVDLRNKGMGLQTAARVKRWHKQYDQWDVQMLSELAKISPGKAAWLKTLDKFIWTDPREGFVNDEHHRIINVFNEKLRRLDGILKSYLNISDEDLRIRMIQRN
jgi:hypothetical protein